MKQNVSLSLEDETIQLLDDLSVMFSGNRSKLVDWMATRNFFLPKEIIDQSKGFKTLVSELCEKAKTETP